MPSLPKVPNLQRKVRVPKDLDEVIRIGEEADPREAGMTPEDIEQIWRGVVWFYKRGLHPSIQLCLRREGHVVLDRSIGHARGNAPQDPEDAEKVVTTPETPFCVYSTSKAITATLIHLLDERGVLRVGDRVAEYLPDYARHGKDSITIAHVLAHRSGVANMPAEALDLAFDQDWEQLAEALHEAKPRTRPGKAVAYAATAGGFVLAEVVRAATGKGIETVLQEEILDPLGFRWTNYGVRDPKDLDLVGLCAPTCLPPAPHVAFFIKRALGVSADEVTRVSNTPQFLTTVAPAANVVSTPNEISRFFEMLRCGGELDGIRLMEPRTIRRALVEQSYLQLDLSLGLPMRYGLGYMLGGKRLSLYGVDTDEAFGHLGFMQTVGWADPERALSGALITSGKPIVLYRMPDLIRVMSRIAKVVPKA